MGKKKNKTMTDDINNAVIKPLSFGFGNDLNTTANSGISDESINLMMDKVQESINGGKKKKLKKSPKTVLISELNGSQGYLDKSLKKAKPLEFVEDKDKLFDPAWIDHSMKELVSKINFYNEVEIYDSFTNEFIISFALPTTEVFTNIRNHSSNTPVAIYQVGKSLTIEEAELIDEGFKEVSIASTRTVTRLFISEKDAKRLRREIKNFYAK